MWQRTCSNTLWKQDWLSLSFFLCIYPAMLSHNKIKWVWHDLLFRKLCWCFTEPILIQVINFWLIISGIFTGSQEVQFFYLFIDICIYKYLPFLNYTYLTALLVWQTTTWFLYSFISPLITYVENCLLLNIFMVNSFS